MISLSEFYFTLLEANAPGTLGYMFPTQTLTSGQQQEAARRYGLLGRKVLPAEKPTPVVEKQIPKAGSAPATVVEPAGAPRVGGHVSTAQEILAGKKPGQMLGVEPPNFKKDLVTVNIKGTNVTTERGILEKSHQEFADKLNAQRGVAKGVKRVVPKATGRNVAAEQQPAGVVRKTVKVGNPAQVAEQQPIPGVAKAATTVVKEQQPQNIAKAATTVVKEQPVTPPRIKTSAVEDLTTGVKKIGSGLGKAAEGGAELAGKGVSAVGKAIQSAGQYAQENPGMAAATVLGGGAAAYLGKKLFGKPAVR